MITIPSIPLSEAEQKKQLKVLEQSVKYDMFTTLDGESIDDELMDLPPYEFRALNSSYSDRIEYFDDICKAEQYVLNGHDIPTELYRKIQNIRQDYITKYISAK